MSFLRPAGYVVITAICLLSWVESAQAVPITYSYTGTVGSAATGIFSGQGSQVTGTFTFDSALIDNNPNGTQDIYSANDPNNLAVAHVFELTVTLGGVTRTTANNQNTPGTDHLSLNLIDSSSAGDLFDFRASLISNTDDFAELSIRDLLPSGSADGIAAGSNNLTSTIGGTIALLDNINVGLFSNAYNSSLWEAVDKRTGASEGSLYFTLTSISRAPVSSVPEPSALLLLSCGLVGLAVWRRKQTA